MINSRNALLRSLILKLEVAVDNTQQDVERKHNLVLCFTENKYNYITSTETIKQAHHDAILSFLVECSKASPYISEIIQVTENIVSIHDAFGWQKYDLNVPAIIEIPAEARLEGSRFWIGKELWGYAPKSMAYHAYSRFLDTVRPLIEVLKVWKDTDLDIDKPSILTDVSSWPTIATTVEQELVSTNSKIRFGATTTAKVWWNRFAKLEGLDVDPGDPEDREAKDKHIERMRNTFRRDQRWVEAAKGDPDNRVPEAVAISLVDAYIQGYLDQIS